jgi:hypothetical protein
MNKYKLMKKVWFEEFIQLRFDDKDFYNQYSESEFQEWCEDYNIK